jgi:hypothetical protein
MMGGADIPREMMGRRAIGMRTEAL